MGRISRKEMNSAVTTAKGTKTVKKEEAISIQGLDEVFYTLAGKQTAGLDEDGNPLSRTEKNAYAKRVRDNKNSRYVYFVRSGSNGRLYNPVDLYGTIHEHKFDSARGRPEFRFVRTKKSVFDLYVNFLRTRNPAWVKHAEREI
jgi:hypothetical protein